MKKDIYTHSIHHHEPAYTDLLSSSFMRFVTVLSLCAKEDPWFHERHLLSVLWLDLWETAQAISLMAQQSLLGGVRRELRFVVETSLKITYIQQTNPNSTVNRKLDLFKSLLNNASISLKGRLDLSLLPVGQRRPFLNEVGRVYGEASAYVHLTKEQILERLKWFEKYEARPGVDQSPEFDKLNTLVERALSSATVLLFHGVPNWVVRDVLEKLYDGMWLPHSSPFVKAVGKTVAELVKQKQLTPRR
ncbi:MAG: hypothetical protein QOF62_3945 [Pyrinomonadaceae bacterium]|jgi:hypothetical protein|nr:hypothetical protein [Pyrinomonadaceae bacterium]